MVALRISAKRSCLGKRLAEAKRRCRDRSGGDFGSHPGEVGQRTKARRHGSGTARTTPQRNRNACDGSIRWRSPRGSLRVHGRRPHKRLKSFQSIAEPGADRILLFAGSAAIAAILSHCPFVLIRILHGQERENYGVTYRKAQQAIAASVPEKLDSPTRAYLLWKRHGQETCKRTKPKCEKCPVSESSAYFAGASAKGSLRRLRQSPKTENATRRHVRRVS